MSKLSLREWVDKYYPDHIDISENISTENRGIDLNADLGKKIIGEYEMYLITEETS